MFHTSVCPAKYKNGNNACEFDISTPLQRQTEHNDSTFQRALIPNWSKYLLLKYLDTNLDILPGTQQTDLLICVCYSYTD